MQDAEHVVCQYSLNDGLRTFLIVVKMCGKGEVVKKKPVRNP